MLEYIQIDKLRDKILLAFISFIVFGFLYTTVNKEDVTFDNAKIGNSMLFSLQTQLFKFDFTTVYGRAFTLSLIQAVLSYVILIL